MDKRLQKIMLGVGTLCLVVILALPAAGLEFKMKTSKYRKIDTKGTIVGPSVFGDAFPGVGVGNVIFSTSPLPAEEEDKYNVKNSFTASELGSFHARGYQPGTTSSIVSYIKQRHPDYEFIKMMTDAVLRTPDGKYKVSTAKLSLGDDSYGWDQRRWDIIPPDDFSNLNLPGALKNGKNTLSISIYLKFQTGTQKEKKWNDSMDKWEIVDGAAIYKDFIISYGDCSIVK